MKTLQISEDMAKRLYQVAPDDFKKQLVASFGTDVVGLCITDIIKSYEDACAFLGENPVSDDDLLSNGSSVRDVARLKLHTICRVLNKGYCYPIFHKNKHGCLSFSTSMFERVDGDFEDGTHINFKTRELSDYAGEQFVDLWREFII